jgi:hypothetical protein
MRSSCWCIIFVNAGAKGRLGSKEGTLLFVFYGIPCAMDNGLTTDNMIHFVARNVQLVKEDILIFFHVFIVPPCLSVLCMFLPIVLVCYISFFRRIVIEAFCFPACKCGIGW